MVIITYNRAKDLETTLLNLLKLPENVGVIIVDNGSSDETETLIKTKFPKLIYKRLPENIYAEARNIGAKMAKTEYIAFTDDDCWWQPGALNLAVEILDKYQKVAAVVAQVMVYGEKPDPLNYYFKTSPLPKFVPMPGPSLMGFLEGAVIMRRKIFLEMGGYNQELKINGEGRRVAIELVKNGWGITYVKEIMCDHYPSPVRNINQRQKDGAKNALMNAVLMEPWENVWSELYLVLRKIPRYPIIILGILEALKEIPRLIKQRQPISPRMKEYFKLLNQQRLKIELK